MELPYKKLKVPQARLVYPLATRENKRTSLQNGIEVHDPYSWMEENSRELQSLLGAQHRLVTTYLGGYPNRTTVLETIRKLFSYTVTYPPKKVGLKYIFVKKMESGQEIFVEQEDLSKNSSQKILVEGLNFPIKFWEPSPNGGHFVYLDSSGRARFVSTNVNSSVVSAQAPEETLEHVVLTSSPWTRDSLGIIYITKSIDFSVHYHQLGTNQDEDFLLATCRYQPGILQVTASVTTCGDYLVVAPQSRKSNQLYFLDLRTWRRSGLPPLPTASVSNWLHIYTYVSTAAGINYFLTNRASPNFSIMTFDLPERSWKTVVAEKDDLVLDWCQLVKSYLITMYVTYEHQSRLHLCSLEGQLLHVFPLDIGRVLYGPSNQSDSEFFFLLVTLANPGLLYRIDLSSPPNLASLEVRQTPLQKNSASLLRKCLQCAVCRRKPTVNPQAFAVTMATKATLSNYTSLNMVTTTVWFRSLDHTRVSMNLTHCVRINPKRRACVLRCHGAGVTLTPDFDPILLAFMNHMDGIVATVNSRGGGVLAGKWVQMQRAVDDIQAAAEFLVGRKYTSSENLILVGYGEGGLTAAMCVNQRPDLFAGAVIHGGVLDLIRTTNPVPHGTAEKAGNLVKFSPYYNIAVPKDEAIQYPSILVVTSSREGHQVADAWQAYKYITQLQSVLWSHQCQLNPLLLRDDAMDETQGRDASVEEATDILCFMSYAAKQIFLG